MRALSHPDGDLAPALFTVGEFASSNEHGGLVSNSSQNRVQSGPRFSSGDPGQVDPETPAVAASAIEDLLGYSDPAGSLSHCAALGYRHLSLSKLVDHLLRRMSLLRHFFPPFYGPILTLYLNQYWGGRSSTSNGVMRTDQP